MTGPLSSSDKRFSALGFGARIPPKFEVGQPGGRAWASPSVPLLAEGGHAGSWDPWLLPLHGHHCHVTGPGALASQPEGLTFDIRRPGEGGR